MVRKRGWPKQSKTFETKEEAQAWAGQIESEMTRDVFVSLGEAERTTLSEALERYYHEVGSQKKHPRQEKQRVEHWKRQPLARTISRKRQGAIRTTFAD
jgi:hypothetical protein